MSADDGFDPAELGDESEYRELDPEEEHEELSAEELAAGAAEGEPTPDRRG